MSDHAWILENLAAYLTGGLEPAERDRLEQHMAECPGCAAVLAESRALDTTLTTLFVEARPSAALEDRLIQTLRNRPPETWRLPVPAWLGIAAAALVLIGFTGSLANQLLVPGGLALPEMSVQSSAGVVGGSVSGYKVESWTDVARLADETRGRMLSELTADDNRARPSSAPVGGRSSGVSDGVPDFEGLGLAPGQATGRPTGSANLRSPNAAWTYGRPPESTADKTPPAPANPYHAAVPMSELTLGTNGFALQSPYMNYFLPMNQPVATGLAKDAGRGESNQFKSGKGDAGQPSAITDLQKQLGNGRGQGMAGMMGGMGAMPKSSGAAPQPPEKKPEEQPGPRKVIIRTGEVEYEVQSFDAAVATITRLIKDIKGGFLATVNSDKLANGKVRGSIVVRVPPEHLDALILDLRTNLGKTGELKNQRLGSQDITKQYTDLESELKAARAMEERLLDIIKKGKGEIKDLLAAEKELGNWRTRIEKIEGELRYYANQVALSTLTITLYEKEIQAPFGIVEREQVQMGVEVDDVDQAYQAAQKAVHEAKGRITRAELKQPSEGQFSAQLDFEVAPDAAGPLRDRLKQLGTVARFDISRLEETEGGTGKPSDGKTRRNDTRFHVHLYNLTNVAPRETVQINLACTDVETALKTLLARVEKAAGKIVTSNLNSARGDQAQADLQFDVKSTLADAVLEDVKAAGEVMRLNVTESSDRQNTTPKKRGFRVHLLALAVAAARESDDIQLACADVATSYRTVQEAVVKARGRVLNAQLNEQDRRNVTATLDFEIRRSEEAVLRAALATAGDIYTRKASRAADADNVVDSKVHWVVTFLNQASIPPRETYTFGVEVADVDHTAALLSALVSERQGRVVEANIARERNGRVTGKLIYDVPLGKAHELLDALKSAGTVRVQQSVKHPEVPDSPLAIARVEVTLSNQELIVPTDEGFAASIRRGLSDSFAVLSWSIRLVILGLCVLLPWALMIWAIYRLVLRMRRRNAPATPATPAG